MALSTYEANWRRGLSGGTSPGLDLGRRVARYRRRRGLTQLKFALLMEKTSQWVYSVECGRRSLDRLSVLRRIAAVLDVPLMELTDEEVS